MAHRVHAAVTVVVTVCLYVASGMPPAVDRTIRPGEAGTDVVMATIEQLEQLNVFPDTNRLLRRIAYAESRDGVDIATYRSGYDGGIWQVDQLVFLQTQDTDTYPELEPLLLRILQLTGLNWLSLPWNELRRPFFSGMAASIYLAVLPDDIPGPGDIAGQARYWKQFYNSDPLDTKEGFIAAVDELESIGTCACMHTSTYMYIIYIYMYVYKHVCKCVVYSIQQTNIYTYSSATAVWPNLIHINNIINVSMAAFHFHPQVNYMPKVMKNLDI